MTSSRTGGAIAGGDDFFNQEVITAAEAARVMSVTKARMAELLRTGALDWRPNPLDGRVKLVHKAEAERLARLPRHAPRTSTMRVAVGASA